MARYVMTIRTRTKHETQQRCGHDADERTPPSYDELQVKEVCRRFVFPGWYRIQLSPLHEYRRGILACTTSYPVAA